MMEARELRIGNLVYFPNNEIVEIYGVSKDIVIKNNGCDFFPISVIDVKPIPLTEQWLLKFGFEVNEFHKNYKIKVDYYHHSIKFYENEWVYSNDVSDASCHTIASVNYVHQLQNIYFALTNEELTIKND
jgi:hypothetical protein